jgi:hypothetical protein
MSSNQHESESEELLKQNERIEQALKSYYKCNWCDNPVNSCKPTCPNKTGTTTGSFKKDDSGKRQWRLLPVYATECIVKVLEFGAKKYAPDNWRKCEDTMRYYDAALRHLLAWKSGEKVDPDSKMPHLWHAACNLLFLVELEK